MEPVTQWVQVQWTKASRGGEAATTRNAVPTAYPLPVRGAPLTHDVLVPEEAGFEPLTSWAPARIDDRGQNRSRRGEVVIESQGDQLSVQLWPAAHPARRHRPPAVVLAPGEWVRWLVNYRISGWRGWSYAQVTMSLANGPVPLEAFLGEPTRTRDERISLF